MANRKAKEKAWIVSDEENKVIGTVYEVDESSARIAAKKVWSNAGFLYLRQKNKSCNPGTSEKNAKTRAKKIADGQIPVTYWIRAKDKKFLDAVAKDVRIAGGLE